MKSESGRMMRWVYGVTMAVMAFTGFGQMPIFKRYYISAIPGMAWSADFYVTLFIHYLGAILLTGLLGYAVADHVLLRRRSRRITPSGYVRAVLLAGMVVSGLFMVLRNMPDVDFSPAFVMMVNLSHLGFMMSYGVAALISCRMRARWVAEASRTAPVTPRKGSLVLRPPGENPRNRQLHQQSRVRDPDEINNALHLKRVDLEQVLGPMGQTAGPAPGPDRIDY